MLSSSVERESERERERERESERERERERERDSLICYLCRFMLMIAKHQLVNLVRPKSHILHPAGIVEDVG